MADNEYVNISVEDFSETVQALAAIDREMYKAHKAHKAKLLAAIQAEVPMPLGKEIKYTAYTRWGQWQMVVGDKAVTKSPSSNRPSLADFLAQQQAAGRAV
jgi:hypothetical protein